MPERPEQHRLLELAALFLRLGCTSFGGPAAHIALMEHEVVRRRRWLTREEFLDLVSAANLIPGPNSTELAIHIGHRRAGWAGLLIAGACFIVPAVLIVAALAWAYVRFGHLPSVDNLLYGVKPVIIAIIAQALWHLGRTAIKSRPLLGLGFGVTVLGFVGLNELWLLVGGGVAMMLIRGVRGVPRGLPGVFDPLLGVTSAGSLVSSIAVGAVPVTLGSLFLFFLKVGSVLYGSGYVLLAFLRADLVERWHWLTEAQLLDAIAVGQVTPGPVFTTATFIGYLLAGPLGAGVATVGIFLPAFLFVAVSGPLVPRLRQSPLASAFLDGVNVASLALMAVVGWRLGESTLVDWLSATIAGVAGMALIRWRINSSWLILAGGVLGVAVRWGS